jgi:hypothetical protein
MPITFEHVEGVVQKAAEPPAASGAGGNTAPTPRPAAERQEDARRRAERLLARVSAD